MPLGAPSSSASAGTSTSGAAVVDRDAPDLALREQRLHVRPRQCGAALAAGSARDARLGQRAPRRARRGGSGRAAIPPRSAPAARAPRPAAPAPAGRTAAGSRARPAITSSPAVQSASSIRFSGLRFHIPPPPAPSKSAEPSGPRSRTSASTRAGDSGSRVDHRAPPAVDAVLAHPPAEERPLLDGQQAGLVGPVLEQPPVGQQRRRRPARHGADTRGEHEPVRAVDRRDRVELDAGEPPHRLGHVVGPAAPESRREPLVRDDVAPQGGTSHHRPPLPLGSAPMIAIVDYVHARCSRSTSSPPSCGSEAR